MISDLSLMAYERKLFLDNVLKIDEAFAQRFKEYGTFAEEKAKQGMELVRLQMRELFNKEWKQIVDSYNAMREHLQYYEKVAVTSRAQQLYLEQEVAQAQRYYKYTPQLSTDFVTDRTFIRDPSLKLEPEDYNEANSLIAAPFSFYGGYLQMTATGRDEFLKEPAGKKLAWYIKQLMLDRQSLLEDKASVE